MEQPRSMLVNSLSSQNRGTWHPGSLERWPNLTAKHTKEFSRGEDKKLLNSCQGVLEKFNPSAGDGPGHAGVYWDRHSRRDPRAGIAGTEDSA